MYQIFLKTSFANASEIFQTNRDQNISAKSKLQEQSNFAITFCTCFNAKLHGYYKHPSCGKQICTRTNEMSQSLLSKVARFNCSELKTETSSKELIFVCFFSSNAVSIHLVSKKQRRCRITRIESTSSLNFVICNKKQYEFHKCHKLHNYNSLYSEFLKGFSTNRRHTCCNGTTVKIHKLSLQVYFQKLLQCIQNIHFIITTGFSGLRIFMILKRQFQISEMV